MSIAALGDFGEIEESIVFTFKNCLFSVLGILAFSTGIIGCEPASKDDISRLEKKMEQNQKETRKASTQSESPEALCLIATGNGDKYGYNSETQNHFDRGHVWPLAKDDCRRELSFQASEDQEKVTVHAVITHIGEEKTSSVRSDDGIARPYQQEYYYACYIDCVHTK